MLSRTTHHPFFTPTLLASAIAGSVSGLTQASETKEQHRQDIEMVRVVGQATSGLDSLVTLEDLNNIQANDLSDIFHLDPSVSVGGSVGMGQKIYVRNIGEDLLNISVDGAEQAGAVFHHSGRVAIEPELLKQVEIEAGTGSATAGPGALGGSVRFTTKDPSDLLQGNEQVGALVKGTYYSNGEGYKGSVSLFGKDSGGIFSGLASFVYSDTDNLEDGNGDEILGTESQKSQAFAKVVADISSEQYLSLSFEELNEEGDILYKPELIATPRNIPEPTEGSRETVILNYGFNSDTNELLDLSLNLYQTKQEQERAYRGPTFDGYVESFGLTLQNRSQLGKHQVIYGINYRDDESLLNDQSTEPFVFTETGSVKGVYLQDIISVSEALTVTAGLRFDDYELEDVNDQKFSDDGVSPNISANYAINDKLSVSAGYAEALRGPEVKDSFKLSSSANSADLEAETAKNAELGLDYIDGNFSFAMGVYQSDIENPIAGSVPWSKLSENLEDDIETLGYFFRTSYSWDSLSLMASFNSADTELNGDPVTRYVYSSAAASTGDTLVLSADYQFSDSLAAGWSAEFVKGLHDLNLQVGSYDLKADKPGYGVHDLYLHWLPMDDDTLTIRLTVRNLFDKQYLHHGSVEDFQANPDWEGIAGSPEAGRDIRVSAALRF